MNKITEDIGAGKPGPGRPKGAQNRITREIKEMVAEALDDAGGVNYLVQQARDNPNAFLTLVGKVIPLQVAGQLNHAVKISGSLAWKPPQ